MLNFKKIILVEHSNDNRETLVELFALSGYSVFQTPSHKAGIELAILQQPELIILDAKGFGDCCCLETITSLKGIPECSNIPIIVLSTNTTREYKASCFDAGGSSFFVKPILFNDMLTSIEETYNTLKIFSAA